MAKKKCVCPKPGLSAPFYMLTYGDMMTLLLTFFVLLFSMSTIQIVKFQAQLSIMKGALGISKLYDHAPMQQNLPAPAVKQSARIIAKAEVSTPAQNPASEVSNEDTRNPARQEEEEQVKAIQALGVQTHMMVEKNPLEIVIVLPTYGLFNKGAYKIDPTSAAVQRVTKEYKELARQVSLLTDFDIYFVGHTDSLPLVPKPGGPKNNMELGFLRAVAIFDFFFADDLTDLTRVSFASQGDNVPIVPNASLDSRRRKNRRVEIRLKKRTS